MQQIRTHLEVEAANLGPLMEEKECAYGVEQAIVDRFAHVQLRGDEDEEEDDGRDLSAHEQYRLEMLSIEWLTPLEERQLADRARAGDTDAGWQLVHQCLPVVWSLAPKYSRWGTRDVDVMDIVQVGNEAMAEHLNEALATRRVCAALVVLAKHAMYNFAVESKDPIRIPVTSYSRGHRAPLTIRIINQDDVDHSYQGILEEMLAASPSVTPAPTQRRNPKRTRVLKALKHLTKHQRLAVMIWFRIDSPRTHRAITRDDTHCKFQFLNGDRFRAHKDNGVKRLRKVLTPDQFYLGVQA